MLVIHFRNAVLSSGKCYLLVGLLAVFQVHGQNMAARKTAEWSLQQCVDYAIKNNISIKQADVQARLAALQLQQAKLYQYPSVAFSTNIGPQFGRSIDPTTNAFSNTELLSQNYSLQGGVQLYNWGRLKHNLAANQFSALAALADAEKTATDVSLNVATAYLQVLGAKEQLHVFDIQIAQTAEQLQITRKRVTAGALPELNLVELEAQLANDSSNYISAYSTFQQNKLSLKALLNLDAAADFEVATPPLNGIPLQPLADLQPEAVYQLALNTQPAQKANLLKTKAAEKNVLANKAALYPTITGNYSLGSIYNNKAQNVTSATLTNAPIGKVTVNNIDYTVYTPYNQYSYGKTPYLTQLNNNFRQSVGLGLSVPIFNNGQNKIAYENAKLNLLGTQLQQDQANQKLKQDVYTAYANAVAALQKYQASVRSIQSAQKAYDFALKRYEVGLLGTLDLITNQNNLSKARIQALINQFDYIFRMKLLEFYKGQQITF